MRKNSKLQGYLSMVLVAGAVAVARGKPDPAGDTFTAPDPGNPSGSTTPDIIEVDVWRSAEQIHVSLEFAGEIRPADDFSAVDLQVLGAIDLGVAADEPFCLSHKSSLTTVPSDLDLIAYLDLFSVSQSTVWLNDGADMPLTSLPIDFGFDTVSVDVPVELFPSPVEGCAVLLHNFHQDTWDMFPNAKGHAVIVPEPTSVALWAMISTGVCWRRRRNQAMARRSWNKR